MIYGSNENRRSTNEAHTLEEVLSIMDDNPRWRRALANILKVLKAVPLACIPLLTEAMKLMREALELLE